MAEKQLPKKEFNSIFWRSFTLLGSFNYERMEGLGFLYAVLPSLKRIYKDDPEGLKEKAISSKLDDPESVEAFLFYTAEKTLFDPIYAGIEVDWSSKLSTAVKNSVYKGDDFIQGIESVTNEVLMKMISIYG